MAWKYFPCNSIDILWTIVHQEMNEGTPATSAAQLRAQVSKALLYMKPTVLENPVAGMLQKCVPAPI